MINAHGSGMPVSHPNLLGNPWFTVNQYDKTNCDKVDWVYFIDRWIGFGHHVEFTSNGIIVSVKAGGTYCSIMQRLESIQWLVGKIATISVLADDKLYFASGTFGEAFTVHFTFGRVEVLYDAATSRGLVQYYGDTTHTITAVKLELGPVSTLAYDAPPNYQQELAKCQRHYQVMRFVKYVHTGLDTWYTPCDGLFQAMRIAPTFAFASTNGTPNKVCDITGGYEKDIVSCGSVSDGSLPLISLQDSNYHTVSCNVFADANIY